MLLKIGAWSGACLSALALGRQCFALVQKIQAVLDRLTQVEVLQKRLLDDMKAVKAGLEGFKKEQKDQHKTERRLEEQVQGLGLALEDVAQDVEELKRHAHVEYGV